jgi:hypothetical protein
MTWNSSTATDYIDLLNQLVQVLTSRHLSAIAINAAGTGYTAGDILGITNTGSTNTHVAQIEVVTVGGGGSITSARIYRGGAYTVDPTTTTGNAATGGTGASATFNLTFAETGWTLRRRTKVAVSATVGAGGSGYSVGNDLTLIGGVLGNGGSAATFNVDTLSGSAVATVSLLSAGQYEVPPANAALTSVSPAGGLGATLNVTYADKSGDTVVVLEGDAGGSNPNPIVAIKTYQGLDESGINTTYNWAVFMATANSQVVPVHELSNVSAGFSVAGDGALTTVSSGDGSFFPCKTSDAFNITWWIRATGRTFVLVAKVASATTTYYPVIHAGLLNPFGITSEMPYPAALVGSSDRLKVWYKDINSLFGGMSDLISRNNGPGFFWGPEGAWTQFRVATIATNTTLTPVYTNAGSATPSAVMWPVGYGVQHNNNDDQIWDFAPATGFDNEDLTIATPVKIYRTPDTGGDIFPLFPLTVVQSDVNTSRFRVLGEVDGAYWFSDGGVAISSEDRFTQGTARYTIFQSGTRVAGHSFYCLRED